MRVRRERTQCCCVNVIDRSACARCPLAALTLAHPSDREQPSCRSIARRIECRVHVLLAELRTYRGSQHSQPIDPA